MSKKLNYIKFRLFFIKAIRKTINSKHEFFKNIKIYDIFYLLLFKLKKLKTSI